MRLVIQINALFYLTSKTSWFVIYSNENYYRFMTLAYTLLFSISCRRIEWEEKNELNYLFSLYPKDNDN